MEIEEAKLSRRAFLAQTIGGVAACGVAGFGTGCGPAARPLPEPFTGPALFEDIRRYAAQGEHRTAGPGDVAAAEWLESHARALGFSVSRIPFRVRQFFLEESSLVVADRPFEVLPQWPVAPADRPIEATLQRLDGDPRSVAGSIALTRLATGHDPKADAALAALLETARTRGARALVVVTDGPSQEIVQRNAPAGVPLAPLPILLAAPRVAGALESFAASAAPARIVLRGRLDPTAEAFDVSARLERGPRWVVVSTPRSGWGPCAGERGPGIAFWRALARYAAGADTGTSWLLLANSGHELGNAGAAAALASADLPHPTDTALWLHLGANLATWDYESLPDGPKLLPRANARRYAVASTRTWPIVAVTLAGSRGPYPIPSLLGFVRGEIKEVLAAGYGRAVGLFGAGLYHHTPVDLPEKATGPALLEPLARGVLALLDRI